MIEVSLRIPPRLIPVFQGDARYRGAKGGRGSAKTRTFAMMTAVKSMLLAEEGRTGAILCGREYMNSLEDSSMEEVKQAIASEPWLAAYFDVGEKYIRTRNGRISFVFCGLRHNLDSIKSKARILLAWIDEAESVSEQAWQKLIPTVREPGSEIWVTWNPERRGSATDKRFVQSPPDNAKIIEINYHDNPWFPAELELARQEFQRAYDPQTYAWIWEGAYRENSNAQVLAGKIAVREFEPQKHWGGPYYGIDWGFSQDPTAGVKLWIDGRTLYVEHEACKVGVENDDLAQLFIATLPGIELHVSRADSARPETISHVKSPGMYNRPFLPRIEAVEKWKGSVEDGISHLRGYESIVVHPRCREFINESRLYSYKTDRITGDILPDVIDKHNHLIDAARYALAPLIKRGVFDISALL